MLPKPLQWLWGDLSIDEVKKFSLLSVTLMFVIGAYWLLRPLKDGIFANIVGIQYQPMAKMVSLCVLVPVILMYSKLIDMVEKQNLFYVICTTYMVGFSVIAYFLAHPTIGIANTNESPYRWLGWITYVTIESFGSLMVALFWSFVASNTDSTSAKKGFPLIIFGAQFGAIAGPTVATHAEKFGLPNLLLFDVACIGMIMVMVTLFLKVIPKDLSLGSQPQKKKVRTGMIEGVKLLATRPYVMGIFAVATLYEVIATIIDFQMKTLAKQAYPTPEALTAFLGNFGQATNGLAMILALLGTGVFMRKFGLRFCLMLFPALTGCIVAYVYFYPGLMTVFGAVMAIKGLSYALNNPVKESMYIPTSKDVKFKAKSWIDMFGNRSAKATGSAFNNFFRASVPALMTYGAIISLGVVGIWICAAAFVGSKFKVLTDNNQIVE